jgi:hypothetical protein
MRTTRIPSQAWQYGLEHFYECVQARFIGSMSRYAVVISSSLRTLMGSTRPVFPLVIASLLLAVGGMRPPCLAQAPPIILQSNASLVLVDVVVTSKGKPVQGLKQSQFKVMEDGRAQSII